MGPTGGPRQNETRRVGVPQVKQTTYPHMKLSDLLGSTENGYRRVFTNIWFQVNKGSVCKKDQNYLKGNRRGKWVSPLKLMRIPVHD